MLRRGLFGLLCVVASAAACEKTPPEPTPTAASNAPAPKPTPVALLAQAPARPARTFVGSARCAECHAKEENAWKHDWHRRALAPASAPGMVVGNFGDAHFKGPSSEATMHMAGGKRVMKTLGTDGNTTDFSVDWVIGGKRMQDDVHVFPDGRYQVLPVYFHVNGKGGEWVDYTEQKQGVLTPSHPFFWANFRRMASRECLDCHATGLDVQYKTETHAWTTKFADPGVACESCHGPGSTHADSTVGTDIFNPAKAGREERTAVCAQCHGPREPLFPMLDASEHFRPGERYEDSFDPIVFLIGADVSGDYFADGKPQTSSFEYQAMLQSKCYRKSDLTCLTCHTAPHAPSAANEVKKTAGVTQVADESCKTCHKDIAAKATEHSHHKSTTCVACHMPPTVSGVGDHFADHAIDVPNLDDTKRHGVPNACGVCHTTKPIVDRLETSFATFWPDAAEKTKRRTRIADAFDPNTAQGSRESLIGVASDAEEAPSLRGAAITLLARRSPPDTARVAEPLLGHESPLLRSKAASALGMSSAQGSKEALAKLLSDESLSVVVSAAVALTSLGDERGQATLEKLAADPRASHLVTVEYSLALQKMRTGDLQGAVPVLQKLLERTPYHADAHVLLADALVRTGHPQEAHAELLEALRFDPQHKGAQDRLRAAQEQ